MRGLSEIELVQGPDCITGVPLVTPPFARPQYMGRTSGKPSWTADK